MGVGEEANKLGWKIGINTSSINFESSMINQVIAFLGPSQVIVGPYRPKAC